ncbi:21.7 kDa class VI heat shock protein isoform X1 [Humulus lupulus]|uniref:21.7 kDa class VI heat shock protein isoform X1 n=1 Tax=Humulus lupulus TaxID=3486 RepID=UPI002B40902F|nr:21.7 kDa class VI heat shock protein isoform X1 [Humulus lupulus]
MSSSSTRRQSIEVIRDDQTTKKWCVALREDVFKRFMCQGNNNTTLIINKVFGDGSLFSPFLFGKFFDPSDAFPLWEFDSDILLSNLRTLGLTTVDWFRTPHDQNYVLKSELPGIGVGKTSVQVVYNEKQKAVEVSGLWNQQQRESKSIIKEWRSGKWWEYGYVRRLELPEDADWRKIEAYLTNDTLLEIKIPKKNLDFESNSLRNDVSTKKSDEV